MRRIVLALAALLGVSTAQAQPVYPANLYPVVQDVPGRWIWRLRTDSVVQVSVPGIGAGVFEFWLIGENRGSGEARYASARIGLDCAGNRWVRERLVPRNAAGEVISDVPVGDHPDHWVPVAAGTSIDGARNILCRRQ